MTIRLSILFLILFSVRGFGQFSIVPTSVSLGGGSYNLTPLSGCGSYQKAAIWCDGSVISLPQFIDFTKCFTLDFQAQFTAQARGADGICAVFGSNILLTTPANNTDGYLGYYNPCGGPANPVYNNSIAVEFDIFDNSYVPCTGDLHDTDHTQISQNGAFLPAIAPAVPIIAATTSVKDGIFHDYRLEWKYTTRTLSVFVDNNLRLTGTISLTTFINPRAVQWGFTGGTGYYCSNQILRNITLVNGGDTVTAHHDTVVCNISGLTLSGTAGFSSYLWDNGATTITRTVTASGNYYVYCSNDSCGSSVLVDSFNILAQVPDSTYSVTDTTVCALVDSITLNAPTGYGSYAWNTGAIDSVLVVANGATYWVYATRGCHTMVDTFQVLAGAVSRSYAVVDTNVCLQTDPITINAPIGYGAYLWNTGATGSSISAANGHSYWVCATEGCATLTDTFHINGIPSPIVAIQTNPSYCFGNYAILSSLYQQQHDVYLWSSGSTDTSIKAFVPGVYWLKVTNTSGCFATDSVSVTLNNVHVAFLENITPNETIEYGKSLQLNVNNAALYAWTPNDGSLSNPNINNPVATPTHTTIYTVYGYDHNGCIDSASVTIYVDSAMNECIPSAFTPNADGINDVFRPACLKFQDLLEFRIYNRWGQQVFYSDSYKKGWDGTFNGVPQDMDTYFYTIILAKPNQGNILYKGDVTLIR